jgi:hypothetical protein
MKSANSKGSRSNKFAFSGVEAHAWQGARRANSTSYLTDEQRCQAGWIGASKCEVIFERTLRVREAITLYFQESKSEQREVTYVKGIMDSRFGHGRPAAKR